MRAGFKILQNRWFLFGAGFVLILVIGILDQVTGHQSSFALMYLVPVMLTAWFMGELPAIMTAAVTTMIWWMADLQAGEKKDSLLPNALIKFTFFLIVSLVLTRLRKKIAAEQHLARTDPVTGAANMRSFNELAYMEIRRFLRYHHVFSVAYIDLDNFKAVNDRLGHTTGDLLLQRVARTLHDSLRATDSVARLGGDEFAVLLPETDQTAARVVFSQINERLVQEMRRHQWPVSFSIGVVSFHAAPDSVSDLIRQADELMYQIKATGKGETRYAVYPQQHGRK
jgi:diguanylate cyclase (GGDEF)-like protein